MSLLNNWLTQKISAKIVELSKFNRIHLGTNGSISSCENVKNSRIMGNVTVGDNAIIYDADISGEISIKENVKLLGPLLLSGNIKIGRNTSINGPNTDLICRLNAIIIGNYCSIARNVSFQEFNHNWERITSYFISHNFFKDGLDKDIYSSGSIEIGHDVWIGTQCTLLSGAKVGNGAIIAANSVVNNEIPDFAIAGGSPAKVIKYRFSEDIIENLKQIEWWNWSDDKLKQNKELFEGKLTLEKLKNIK